MYKNEKDSALCGLAWTPKSFNLNFYCLLSFTNKLIEISSPFPFFVWCGWVQKSKICCGRKFSCWLSALVCIMNFIWKMYDDFTYANNNILFMLTKYIFMYLCVYKCTYVLKEEIYASLCCVDIKNSCKKIFLFNILYRNMKSFFLLFFLLIHTISSISIRLYLWRLSVPYVRLKFCWCCFFNYNRSLSGSHHYVIYTGC